MANGAAPTTTTGENMGGWCCPDTTTLPRVKGFKTMALVRGAALKTVALPTGAFWAIPAKEGLDRESGKGQLCSQSALGWTENPD